MRNQLFEHLAHLDKTNPIPLVQEGLWDLVPQGGLDQAAVRHEPGQVGV